MIKKNGGNLGIAHKSNRKTSRIWLEGWAFDEDGLKLDGRITETHFLGEIKKGDQCQLLLDIPSYDKIVEQRGWEKGEEAMAYLIAQEIRSTMRRYKGILSPTSKIIFNELLESLDKKVSHNSTNAKKKGENK